MISSSKENSEKNMGCKDYAKLTEYSGSRRKQFVEMLAPVIEITDRYGELICRITRVLGNSSPRSLQDKVVRDLMADVFDFLWEWRRPLFEGRLQVAYPLARRAYESLSLMSICIQDSSFAERWGKGERLSNAEIRKALAIAPMAESEDALKEVYRFFSRGTHPNRDLIAYRFLGEGNEFVLGSIIVPDLALIVDHCIRLVQMWFWYAAGIMHFYHTIIDRFDRSITKNYFTNAETAKKTATWLIAVFNGLLEERQELHKKDKSSI